MAKHNELGILGEKIAANHLIHKGYILLERQWRYKHKEIDLIFQKGNTLIIVEVKSRSSQKFSTTAELITQKKIEFLIEAGEAYSEKNNFSGSLRFDVIAIYFNENTYSIEHIENAFVSQ